MLKMQGCQDPLSPLKVIKLIIINDAKKSSVLCLAIIFIYLVFRRGIDSLHFQHSSKKLKQCLMNHLSLKVSYYLT